MSATTTIKVEFGAGVDATALAIAELDETVNIDAAGDVQTTFEPGETPGFLLHYNTNALRVGNIACSSGMVISDGTVVRTRSKQMSWQNSASQELPHIPSSIVAWVWYGNDPSIGQSGRTLTPRGLLPAIGEAVYSIRANAYRLIPESGSSWPVLITITMENK